MIFGRFKRTDDERDEVALDDVSGLDKDSEFDEDSESDEGSEFDDESAGLRPGRDATDLQDDDLDQWQRLDASRNWREDGPFDISEVDLDADEVERLDFGCVVLTPFDGMQIQLQVDQRTQKVQAALVLAGASAIEIALFAAPAQSSMVAEIREEMIAATEKAGGRVSLAGGPFGTEVRRVVPMTDPKGNRVFHISRTWFAQGPKWLLRGVVMGEAGQAEGVEGVSELLYEFFSNTVVRRDHQPRVPGDLIPMAMPGALATSAPGSVGDTGTDA